MLFWRRATRTDQIVSFHTASLLFPYPNLQGEAFNTLVASRQGVRGSIPLESRSW
jgi:hypothetical protein